MNRKKSILSLILVTIITISLISCANQAETESKTSSIFQRGEVKNCKITVDNADIKAKPDEDARTITTLNKNKIVKVLGKIGDWYVVKLNSKEIGCINKSQASPVVKEGQEPPKPLPTQDPPREEAPPTEVEPAKDVTTMERKMINQVNSERSKKGLSPYKVDKELSKIARIKARDMVKNNYFSHYSPTYGSPFEMMDHFGIEYLRAGENLAGNQSVNKAHNSLMNSKGHRENILNKNFTRIGVGIKSSDKYGYIFVQMFISKPQ